MSMIRITLICTLFILHTPITAAASDDDIPSAVEHISATPDPQGLGMVDIDFTTPSVSTTGKPLTSIAKIMINRDGKTVRALDNPRSSTRYIWVDTDVPSGIHIYSVATLNAAGKGSEVSVECRLGINKPERVNGVKVTENSATGDITVRWSAPSTDTDGFILKEGSITYNLYNIDQWGDTLTIARGLTSTEYTGKSSHGFAGFFVTAENTVGASAPSETVYTYIGESTSLPYTEHARTDRDIFAIGNTWYLVKDSEMDSADGDGCFLAISGDGKLLLRKLKMDTDEAVAVIYASYMDTDKAHLELHVQNDSEERMYFETELTETIEEGRWMRIIVPLSGLSGKSIIPIIHGHCTAGGLLGIDNIKVMSLEDFTLSAKEVCTGANIQINKNEIDIISEGDEIAIFSADGRAIASAYRRLNYTLNSGIYIVVAGSNVYKVLIK